MQLAISPQNESMLHTIANELNTNISDIVNESINEFIKQYKSKKIDLMANDIYNRYLEAKEAHEKGIKLQSLDELIDEL